MNQLLVPKLAIVASLFNQELMQSYVGHAVEALKHQDICLSHEDVIWVPGAIEIPYAVQQLLRSNHYDAIITLGLVIQGQTAHFDYVCQQVSHGCMRVMLDFNTPVLFGVLTTENAEQADQRINGERNKAQEVVNAALSMIDLTRRLLPDRVNHV